MKLGGVGFYYSKLQMSALFCAVLKKSYIRHCKNVGGAIHPMIVLIVKVISNYKDL